MAKAKEDEVPHCCACEWPSSGVEVTCELSQAKEVALMSRVDTVLASPSPERAAKVHSWGSLWCSA